MASRRSSLVINVGGFMLSIKSAAYALVLCFVLSPVPVLAQGATSSIQVRATDSAGGLLQGAIVTVTPGGGSYVTDNQGQYVIRGLVPGDYTLSVDYVGFLAFMTQVHITEGQVQRVDASLQVATQSEQVLV